MKGKHDKVTDALGIGEELGELAGPLALLVAAQMGKTQHAMLKNIQGISEHESQASDGEIKGWPARSPGNTHSEAHMFGTGALSAKKPCEAEVRATDPQIGKVEKLDKKIRGAHPARSWGRGYRARALGEFVRLRNGGEILDLASRP